jgi:D-beta-D-heptose 7-phosphate kinase/D-beta-D-heptose 1-phosphate adenosyltransferase
VSKSARQSGRLGPADFVDRCRDREVWIIGDLMLDEYVHGAVERISPEAPVPVVRADQMQYRLGGAANVARQVAALGAHAVLGGVIGDDAVGSQLIADCEAVEIDTRGVCRDAARRTTRKLRVLGHGQQLLRLDWEDVAPCDPGLLGRLMQQMQAGREPDIVILSDYAKGVLTDRAIESISQFARGLRCPVLVDPKRADLTAYRGTSFLTPNLGELSRAARRRLDPDDHKAIESAARPLVEAANIDGMIVTLGDRGMLHVAAGGAVQHVPAMRRAVADVTGAGDTAIAVLATTLAAGASIEDAMRVANAAAGQAVAEIGAVAIKPDHIKKALHNVADDKVIGRAELAARAAAWRAGGKDIVFTNGCFDLLHAGHLSLLNEAASLGDVLVLAINSDASVRRLKGHARPIVPARERAALLAALSCVDVVTIYEEDTPLETLRAVRPSVLVKGGDYDLSQVVGRDLVEADGGRVALVPLLDTWSTSALLERIRNEAGSLTA